MAAIERPVEHPTILQRFQDCFHLQRRDRQTKLSVVVPWPKSAPDLERIRHSVLNECARPILRGRLIFEVQGEVIEAAPAKRLMPEILASESAARFVEVAAMAGEPAITLPELQAHPKQELVEEQLDQAILGTLRASYSGGYTVAVPGYLWGLAKSR